MTISTRTAHMLKQKVSEDLLYRVCCGQTSQPPAGC